MAVTLISQPGSSGRVALEVRQALVVLCEVSAKLPITSSAVDTTVSS